MIRIAEKLGFMKVRAVTVCAKAGISRKVGTNNHVFLAISNKTASKTKILDSSR
jgi:Holliday junction resolvase